MKTKDAVAFRHTFLQNLTNVGRATTNVPLPDVMETLAQTEMQLRKGDNDHLVVAHCEELRGLYEQCLREAEAAA